jgi:hypothetical protein
MSDAKVTHATVSSPAVSGPASSTTRDRPTVVMSDDARPQRIPGAVEAEVDGERILLAPKDFSYFGLTGSAAAVWDGIDGDVTVGELVSRLEEDFEAEVGQVRSDTLSFMDALMAAGLIELPQD